MNSKVTSKKVLPPVKKKTNPADAKSLKAPNHEKATGLHKTANSKGKEEEDHYTHIPAKSKFYKTKVPKLESTPILIEVLIRTDESAMRIINSVAEANKKSKTQRILAIGLNGKNGEKGVDIKKMDSQCAQIVKAMEQAGVAGYCSAFTWTPTTKDEGGYIFPFKEARSLLTLNDGAEAFQNELAVQKGSLIVRSIDEDVINDPLYNAELGENVDKLIKNIELSPKSVMTGGYEWHATTESVTERLKTFKFKEKISEATVAKIVGAINIINKYEHLVRSEINKISERSIYVPEPNAYMHLETRRNGARMNLKSIIPDTSQQGEGKLFLYTDPKTSIQYDSEFKTTKPLKGHLDKLILNLYNLIKKGSKDVSQIANIIEGMHQSHLSEGIINDIQKWRIKDEQKAFGKSSYIEGTTAELKEVGAKFKHACAEEIAGIL